MSVFKPFITSDVVVSPFKVNKQFTFGGLAPLTGSGIDIFEGINPPTPLWISGSNPTGYITTQDKYLVYKSIRELYYYNYLYGLNGSPTNTSSFNPDGTITGQPYTPSAYNYLSTTLDAERLFPTSSIATIGVLSIPSNIFGEYVKPSTFKWESPLGTITDDGEGRLMFSSSIYAVSDYLVGNIIYEHGISIINKDALGLLDGYGYVTYGVPVPPLPVGLYGGIFASLIAYPTLIEFQSTVTIYEAQYKCTIRENEFNFSQNPTLISGSTNSGVLYSFATGSYFDPYVTTVGLYNNSYDLIAVAKLAQPVPLSSVTDMNIVVNLDL